MPIVPTGLVRQSEIASSVRQVERSLAPDVAHIFYEIEPDWRGEWAIFFRVVLSDDAAKNRLRKIATHVVQHLAEALDFQALGLLPYHNFRSESEQAALREDVWA